MDLTPMWFGVYKALKYLLYPFSWIVIAGLFTLLTACFPVSPRRTTWVRRFALLTVLLLLLTATPLLSSLYIALLESQYPPFQPTSTSTFDAVVVLAGSVYQKGSLRPIDEVADASRQRTACGADLWQSNLAPRMLVTGGDATILRTGPRVSHEMKRWALRLGVPESAILVEDKSRTTYENAVQTKALLGSGRILLVTSAYHLPRAVSLFEKQGFIVTPAACGYESQHTPQQIWEQATLFDLLPTAKALLVTTQAIEEVAGIIVYWLAGKL
ncbi:MAG: YdcF family protein [Nitrospira sp.]|nr:YdcF family protein [Nitrospira sp.]MBP6606429.1 YdcF family protein [Nitrospira sp.]HQY57445.1 YdcF family protein [Nitrospira sp.]HRA96198.1 YdcF family protein [Nitrospira sp.]